MPTALDTEPMPKRIAKLRRDKHGYPVPWFVAWVDGVPDFRLVPGSKSVKAERERRCWVCGGPRARGAVVAFLIGPMCSVNRVAPEPPSHPECAEYSAKVCPFLATPNMVRRERGMDDRRPSAGGLAIQRNPGVALVWLTRSWLREEIGNGPLWFIGEPIEVRWFAHGRTATRAEVEASIASGLPTLRGVAAAESPQAVAELEQLVERAQVLLPA